MNTKEQDWEKDFDKIFVEQTNHRGGRFVREEASKIIDFIRETREQAKKDEKERIKTVINKERSKNIDKSPNGFIFKIREIEGICKKILQGIDLT